jgi:hypothetical protein
LGIPRENVHEYDFASRQASQAASRATVHATTNLFTRAAREHHVSGLGAISELDLNFISSYFVYKYTILNYLKQTKIN